MGATSGFVIGFASGRWKPSSTASANCSQNSASSSSLNTDLRFPGKLVGAVGIENNDDWNPKDLREMRRNAKSLQRNDEAGKGILIAPSFSPFTEVPAMCYFHPKL